MRLGHLGAAVVPPVVAAGSPRLVRGGARDRLDVTTRTIRNDAADVQDTLTGADLCVFDGTIGGCLQLQLDILIVTCAPVAHQRNETTIQRRTSRASPKLHPGRVIPRLDHGAVSEADPLLSLQRETCEAASPTSFRTASATRGHRRAENPRQSWLGTACRVTPAGTH